MTLILEPFLTLSGVFTEWQDMGLARKTANAGRFLIAKAALKVGNVSSTYEEYIGYQPGDKADAYRAELHAMFRDEMGLAQIPATLDEMLTSFLLPCRV